jgi:hypothetical protein
MKGKKDSPHLDDGHCAASADREELVPQERHYAVVLRQRRAWQVSQCI